MSSVGRKSGDRPSGRDVPPDWTAAGELPSTQPTAPPFGVENKFLLGSPLLMPVLPFLHERPCPWTVLFAPDARPIATSVSVHMQVCKLHTTGALESSTSDKEDHVNQQTTCILDENGIRMCSSISSD